MILGSLAWLTLAVSYSFQKQAGIALSIALEDSLSSRAAAFLSTRTIVVSPVATVI